MRQTVLIENVEETDGGFYDAVIALADGYKTRARFEIKIKGDESTYCKCARNIII